MRRLGRPVGGAAAKTTSPSALQPQGSSPNPPPPPAAINIYFLLLITENFMGGKKPQNETEVKILSQSSQDAAVPRTEGRGSSKSRCSISNSGSSNPYITPAASVELTHLGSDSVKKKNNSKIQLVSPYKICSSEFYHLNKICFIVCRLNGVQDEPPQ